MQRIVADDSVRVGFIAPHGVLHEQHTATNRDLQQRANVPATMLDCLDRAFLVFAHPPCIPSAGGSPLRNRPILVHRRVDIVIVNCSAWGTATLAWTGSTQFNRDIRKVAMKKGSVDAFAGCSSRVLILWISWNLDAGGMTNEHGVDLPCPQETDVFRRLGLEYIRTFCFAAHSTTTNDSWQLPRCVMPTHDSRIALATLRNPQIDVNVNAINTNLERKCENQNTIPRSSSLSSSSSCTSPTRFNVTGLRCEGEYFGENVVEATTFLTAGAGAGAWDMAR